jgi:hypothetical protein
MAALYDVMIGSSAVSPAMSRRTNDGPSEALPTWKSGCPRIVTETAAPVVLRSCRRVSFFIATPPFFVLRDSTGTVESIAFPSLLRLLSEPQALGVADLL